nr:hypothetical protein [Tanacetum cinerariifolium]
MLLADPLLLLLLPAVRSTGRRLTAINFCCLTVVLFTSHVSPSVLTRVKMLEKELKARTSPIKVHKINRGRSGPVMAWVPKKRLLSATITLSNKAEDPILGRKFNFSKYIFDSLVRNIDSSSKFYMYPRFIQLIIQNQLSDLSTHNTKYTSPALTQKVFANMKRVEKGFSGVKTPLFEGMLVVKENVVEGIVVEQVQDDVVVVAAPEGVTTAEEEKKTEQAKDIVDDDQVEGRQAEIQAEIYQIDMDHPLKVLSMNEDELAKVEEVVEVVTTAKLITEVTAVSTPVSAPNITILAAGPHVPAATPTVVLDKGKGKLVEEPKPLKKKQQVELDEELDYFKGMSYDDIRLIFEAMFNTNIEFLLKSKEQIEEEENRAIKSINETPAQKATKRRKLNEEFKEVEDLKQHLEIVHDEDDGVYTEATLLARKVPVVDYEIIQLNNKPRYKIIKADGTHQLYASFITLLKNFDREDLESLWSIVKERFSTSKPNNFANEYLLTTLKIMFGIVKGLALGLMLPRSLKKNTKCFNAVGEELSAVKHKLMRLDTAAD